IAHIFHWRLNWDKKDLDFYPEEIVSSKFITARQSALLIRDGSTCISAGIAGNARCSVFFWAIRESFLKTGHPKDLTWISVAAQGGRGKAPGTIEEIGLPGLLKCYISGHLETARAQLDLAAQGKLELHTLPQGVMSFILEAMAKEYPRNYCDSIVGLHTFFDPRTGNGTAIAGIGESKCEAVAENLLRYSMPRIDLAFFCVPYADNEGNLYFHDASTISENMQSAKAARANGGKAIATVSRIIPKNETLISMRADEIDHIVVHPHNEQTASVRQKRFWPMFTAGSKEDPLEGIKKIKFINHFLKITPVRTETDHLLGRLAAFVFTRVAHKGCLLNIGVGFPEEVGTQLMKHNLHHDIVFTTEAGAFGGLPASGIFFGASINPKHLESSTEMFRRYENKLDVALLGFLQIDSLGNINGSKKGARITEYVGPGGMPDIAAGAKVLLFVGTWMAGAKFAVKDRQLIIEKKGRCKFVKQVDQVTFNGVEALKSGKKVFYITNVGVFILTEQGLTLTMVMPGIDIEKDILGVSEARILLPRDNTVTVVDTSIFNQDEYKIEWS
ncbi:MAG TPA: hypothetical protein VFP87_11720, partial [Chitinophagaceae bacterium]|nr:hypothetical protein [Chitinophagaceae bacterium]